MVFVRLVLERLWALVAAELRLVKLVLHETIDLFAIRVLVDDAACWASVLNSGPLLDARCACQAVAT